MSWRVDSFVQYYRNKCLNICKVVDGKYYGKNGAVVSEQEYKNQCLLMEVCDGNKAPGPDGMNLNFIKANWGVIQGDFMRFLHEFYEEGSIVKDLNNTFIALIPKCGSPESMKDFRPISLVSSLYKVLSEILANRLKRVMDSIIGET